MMADANNSTNHSNSAVNILQRKANSTTTPSAQAVEQIDSGNANTTTIIDTLACFGNGKFKNKDNASTVEKMEILETSGTETHGNGEAVETVRDPALGTGTNTLEFAYKFHVNLKRPAAPYQRATSSKIQKPSESCLNALKEAAEKSAAEKEEAAAKSANEKPPTPTKVAERQNYHTLATIHPVGTSTRQRCVSVCTAEKIGQKEAHWADTHSAAGISKPVRQIETSSG